MKKFKIKKLSATFEVEIGSTYSTVIVDYSLKRLVFAVLPEGTSLDDITILCQSIGEKYRNLRDFMCYKNADYESVLSGYKPLVSLGKLSDNMF